MSENWSRRGFAAAALLALAPGQSLAAIKVVSGNRSSKTTNSGSTTTTSTTTATSSTSTATSTSGSTTTTATGDSYCGVTLDKTGRTTFANHTWALHRDTRKTYPIQQALGILPLRHRFETRSGDAWKSEVGRNRAEFECATKHPFGRDVWFSYAMRIRGGAPVTNWNLLGQFHNTSDSGDSGGISPPFSVNLIPGEKLRFIRRFDPAPLQSVPQTGLIMHERVVERDRWYRIVGRVVFGWQNNAAVDLWFDGVKVVSLANTNIGYNDLIGPYWKFGIYRAQAAETLIVDYSNMELGSSSLLGRVTSPLAII